MTEKTKTLGVWVRRETRHGGEYVVACVMRREDEARHPINATDNYDERGPYVEGLRLEGYVADYGQHAFHLFDVAYHDVYAVNLSKAGRMQTTLKRVRSQIEREHAQESGDVLMAFCRAIGAKWAVVEVEHRGTMLSD